MFGIDAATNGIGVVQCITSGADKPSCLLNWTLVNCLSDLKRRCAILKRSWAAQYPSTGKGFGQNTSFEGVIGSTVLPHRLDHSLKSRKMRSLRRNIGVEIWRLSSAASLAMLSDDRRADGPNMICTLWPIWSAASTRFRPYVAMPVPRGRAMLKPSIQMRPKSSAPQRKNRE